MGRTVRIKILRQDGAANESHWDVFEIAHREKMNVVSALMEIRKRPSTTEGKDVVPPAWEAACLEEVCGSCTMNINGRVRQACTAMIEELCEVEGDAYVLTLEPMKKFPLVRDLIVDRSRMFEGLIKVKAWVPIDGSYDRGAAPPQDDSIRKLRYKLSECMTCGCCMEACPQVNADSEFIGASALGQTLLFNLHPVGSSLKGDRYDYITSEEGITNCGNAQNCAKACPKELPLTQVIAQLNRDTTVHKLREWIGLAG
jgi:succinate dehydrogenase / fumarate reductase iron-sulfur subunit